MYSKTKLCQIAKADAVLNLQWLPGPNNPAHKFTQDFEATFGKARFSWCAATVRYWLIQAGLNVPIKNPSSFGYTFAYVPAWHSWAESMGFFHLNDGKYQPSPGCVVIYDWDQKTIGHDDLTDNHIGIHLQKTGSGLYEAAEGNTSNMTAIRDRSGLTIKGWIDIPEDFEFVNGLAQVKAKDGSTTPVYGNDDAFVRAFQLFYKLNVDGDPGPATYSALAKIKG